MFFATRTLSQAAHRELSKSLSQFNRKLKVSQNRWKTMTLSWFGFFKFLPQSFLVLDHPVCRHATGRKRSYEKKNKKQNNKNKKKRENRKTTVLVKLQTQMNSLSRGGFRVFSKGGGGCKYKATTCYHSAIECCCMLPLLRKSMFAKISHVSN